MKTIYLIRHAKSDWSAPDTYDAQRGLSKRGKKAIPIMAKALHEKHIKPDLIISSPAKRTKLTAKGLLKELGYSQKIIYQDDLYLADPDTMLSVVKSIDDKYRSIFLIGHNPGITEFANLMSDGEIENIPTLGIVALHCTSKRWEDCGYHHASLEFFIYPKMLKE
ncbi:MAG: histidine phosphatase family protein [Campylobacterales bacterium]|nr:histidine phosphatase family protein [Campylobacterales bacterium]